MDKKQIELLERVLLLMKYDNKQTYSENQKNVLVEQSMGGGFTPQYHGERMAETIKWLDTPGEPRTPFKDITLCNGTYRVPESAELKMPLNTGLIIGLDWHTDEIGYYNTVSEFRRRFSKPKMFSSVSDVTEETKVYYPTSGYLGSVMKLDLPIGFKILKGTKKPVEEVTEWFDADLDEIVYKEIPDDITCTIFTSLPVENFDIAIHPEKYNDESRGWQMKPHVYYQNPDKQGEWVPYDPKEFIDERTEGDAWWDKYGIFVELTGQLLIDIGCSYTGPLKFACSAILGAAFNLPIANYYMGRGDTHSASVSFVFAAFPFLHGAYGKAAEKLIAKMGLETFDKACVSISGKILQQAPKTGAEWATFYKTLTYSEKEAMVIVSKMEQSALKNGMEIATKKAVGEMIAKGITVNTVRGIFGSLIRGDLKSLITRFPYIKSGKNLTRFISYTALDITTMKGLEIILEKVKGEKLTPMEQYGVLFFITSFPEDEQVNVVNSLIQGVQNETPEFIESAKEITNKGDEVVEAACKNVPQDELVDALGEEVYNLFCPTNKSKKIPFVPDNTEEPKVPVEPIKPEIQKR
jgi:hypothetical protein